MKRQQQLPGMRGVYLTAAELSKLGFIVCTTSRNAQGADLLITDQQCLKTFSVQVKTNNQSTPTHFLIGKKGKDMVSETHVYVLLNILKPSKKNPIDKFEYYVVPSKVIAEKLEYMKSKSGKAELWFVRTKNILLHKDKWDILGNPESKGQS
jgi:hypothetical protein